MSTMTGGADEALGVHGQEAPPLPLGVLPAAGAAALTVGVEEEFHVIDLRSRRPVPRAPELLDRMPRGRYAAELLASIVETNSGVHLGLEELRDDLAALRTALAGAASQAGLGILASGTPPLPPVSATVTPTTRFLTMLDDYALLAREQFICGMQVHVGLPDRELAVEVAARTAPLVPLLLALTASSPWWQGADSGYASARSLVWQRWPTAGPYDVWGGAEGHDRLVSDLMATGVIRDPKMIYFDVRPSPRLPTLELRICDACPDVDDVMMVAGLFRAMVAAAMLAVRDGRPALRVPAPLLRAAAWRASRSGLEGDLLDLSVSSTPIPAGVALRGLVDRLRPQLTEAGDAELVTTLVERAFERGSSAERQRQAYVRRERMGEVVDLLLEETLAGGAISGAAGAVALPPVVAPDYDTQSDEAITASGEASSAYAALLPVLRSLGVAALHRREAVREGEQRAHDVTFTVGGERRLFPVDLVPRVVPAEDVAHLERGLLQRARALDAFLHDVYGARQVVSDGVLPADLVRQSPGLRPTGALARHQLVRAHVSGMDLVRDGRTGQWLVLEDNLRIPSGLGYAVQNRRLSRTVLPELPTPVGLVDVESAPALLLQTLREAAPETADGDPGVVMLSEGPTGSAWFEHRMLGEEMGIPVLAPDALRVLDGRLVTYVRGERMPVDVIYLRMGEEELLHSAGADGRPLGPPLLGVLDAGRVSVCNAPGNGVGDDKAVYAYVPELIRYYLGEEPALASVPTYLCGDPDTLQTVLPRIGELVLKPVDGYGGEGVLIGPLASEEEVDATRRQVLAAPDRWIAQELVSLSTHPTFDGSGLVPRHVDLRAFVLLGRRARLAPAALTRVAPAGSMIVNSSRGGGAKDTWMLR